MKKFQDIQKARDELLNAFDKTLQAGDWESSLFFRTLGKRLREIREQVAKELAVEENTQTQTKSHTVTAKAGYINVYVSLYQAEGNNLARWKNAITGLTTYSVSRPIYKEEEHIKALIRSKADPKREAYVVAWVKEGDIIPSYKPMEDRFGHELVMLKEHAIRLENIAAFVHEDKRYQFVDGELVL